MQYRTIRRLTQVTLCALLPLSLATNAACADEDNDFDVSDMSEADQATMQLVRDVQRYQLAVQQHELNGGAWDENLSQELLGFGTVLQRQGEHEQAIEIFDRAAHLARVTFGLDTLEQIPALQGRINSHIAMGEWDEADRQQQYAYYVHSRGLNRNDPDLVDALAQYAQWSLASYFRGLGEFPHVRLVDAVRLYSAAHALAVEHYQDDPERLNAYLNDVAGSAYLVARTNAVQVANTQPNARGFNEFAVVEASVLDTYRYRSSGFSQGEAALIKAIELQAGLPGEHYSVVNHAEAIAMLGDWYLLFDRRQAGMRHYREAWELLAGESPEQAHEFFARVQLLPQFNNFSEQRRLAAVGRREGGAEYGYVDLSFNVNQYGRLSNVDVLAIVPDDSERRVNRLLRELRQSVVRPRLEDGEPVDMVGVSMRVPYRY